MDNAFHDFIGYITYEKGYSLHTVDAYHHDIKCFILFIKKKKIYCFRHIRYLLCLEYFTLLNSKYSVSTIRRKISSLKALFKFLLKEGSLKRNVFDQFELPKNWQKIPIVLSIIEMELLLKQPKSLRDIAIMELLYSCGLRVSELCILNLKDIDDGFIRIFGKGSRERIIPIGRKANQAINKYVTNARKPCKCCNTEKIFLTRNGHQISRGSIWKQIKYYATHSDIQKIISPHTLRHTYATHLYENGADIRIIQELLGHRNINSTEKYVHISTKYLTEAFNLYHPRP